MTIDTSHTRRVLAGGLFAACLALAPAGVGAQPQDPIETRDGIRHACTGVGLGAREDPRWRAFAVRIEFAAASGRYLAGVATEIEDPAGQPVFSITCNGPWLVLDLPPGNYRVTASVEGERETRGLTVGESGQTVLTIRFPAITEL